MLQESKPRTKKTSSKKKATQAQSRTTRSKKPAAKSEKQVPPSVTSEQRHQMIAESAYIIAQQRGFVGGNPLDDWLSAEAQIDEQLLKEPG